MDNNSRRAISPSSPDSVSESRHGESTVSRPSVSSPVDNKPRPLTMTSFPTEMSEEQIDGIKAVMEQFMEKQMSVPKQREHYINRERAERISHMCLLGKRVNEYYPTSLSPKHPYVTLGMCKANKRDRALIDNYHVTYESIESNHVQQRFLQTHVLKDGALVPNKRVAIVEDWLAIVASEHHRLAHCGIQKLEHWLKERYAFKPAREYIAHFIEHCTTCILQKKRSKDVQPIKAQRSTGVWHNLVMDLVDMGETEYQGRRYRYIFHLIDKFSGFAIALPIENKDAPSILNCLLMVFSLFHYPLDLQSDNGREFKNKIVRLLCAGKKVLVLYGRAYTPRDQGVIEQANGTLKQAIYKLIADGSHTCWVPAMYEANMMMNSTLRRSTKQIPHECMFGRKTLRETDFDVLHSIYGDGHEDIDDEEISFGEHDEGLVEHATLDQTLASEGNVISDDEPDGDANDVPASDDVDDAIVTSRNDDAVAIREEASNDLYDITVPLPISQVPQAVPTQDTNDRTGDRPTLHVNDESSDVNVPISPLDDAPVTNDDDALITAPPRPSQARASSAPTSKRLFKPITIDESNTTWESLIRVGDDLNLGSVAPGATSGVGFRVYLMLGVHPSHRMYHRLGIPGTRNPCVVYSLLTAMNYPHAMTRKGDIVPFNELRTIEQKLYAAHCFRNHCAERTSCARFRARLRVDMVNTDNRPQQLNPEDTVRMIQLIDVKLNIYVLSIGRFTQIKEPSTITSTTQIEESTTITRTTFNLCNERYDPTAPSMCLLMTQSLVRCSEEAKKECPDMQTEKMQGHSELLLRQEKDGTRTYLFDPDSTEAHIFRDHACSENEHVHYIDQVNADGSIILKLDTKLIDNSENKYRDLLSHRFLQAQSINQVVGGARRHSGELMVNKHARANASRLTVAEFMVGQAVQLHLTDELIRSLKKLPMRVKRSIVVVIKQCVRNARGTAIHHYQVQASSKHILLDEIEPKHLSEIPSAELLHKKEMGWIDAEDTETIPLTCFMIHSEVQTLLELKQQDETRCIELEASINRMETTDPLAVAQECLSIRKSVEHRSNQIKQLMSKYKKELLTMKQCLNATSTKKQRIASKRQIASSKPQQRDIVDASSKFSGEDDQHYPEYFMEAEVRLLDDGSEEYTKFKVKWKNFSEDQATWEPAAQFPRTDKVWREMIAEFERRSTLNQLVEEARNPTKKKPLPKRKRIVISDSEDDSASSSSASKRRNSGTSNSPTSSSADDDDSSYCV